MNKTEITARYGNAIAQAVIVRERMKNGATPDDILGSRAARRRSAPHAKPRLKLQRKPTHAA